MYIKFNYIFLYIIGSKNINHYKYNILNYNLKLLFF